MTLNPSTNRKQPNAWLCTLINLLAFPGLGTIMAGKRIGYLQAALMLAGFFLTMGFMVWYFVCTFQFLAGSLWTEEQYTAHYRPYTYVWKIGAVFCLVSWFWSLASSLALLRNEKK